MGREASTERQPTRDMWTVAALPRELRGREALSRSEDEARTTGQPTRVISTNGDHVARGTTWAGAEDRRD